MFFFFNDTATTEIYTLSLHDALPICSATGPAPGLPRSSRCAARRRFARDRKSTRLNSSHGYISYAVFCLKKKNPRLLIALPLQRLRRERRLSQSSVQHLVSRLGRASA